MILDFEILDLETRHPFRIARPGAQAKRRTVWIRLTDADGVEGWGEAAANNYYGETVDTVAAVLPRLAEALEEAGTGDPFALERIELALDQAISGCRSGSCGGCRAMRRRFRPLHSASTSPTSCVPSCARRRVIRS